MMSKAEKDKKAWRWIVLIGAIFASGLFAYGYQQSQPQPDRETLCSEFVPAKTIFIVDHSETVSKQTLDAILARASSYIRSATTGEQFSVFLVSELSRKNLSPSFVRCKPKSEAHWLTEDERMITRVFKKKFEEPLRNELRRDPSGSVESPIAQALIDLSLSEYLNAPRARIVVFSDMLQNAPGFSVYSCSGNPIEAFRNSRRGASERPTFRNTDFDLHLIPRPGQRRETLACRDKFWSWFFGDAPGSKDGLKVEYLPG